jgi:hypothetical protein
MLYLLDRRGSLLDLDHLDGECASRALVKNGIPPTSVLIYRNTDDGLVADSDPLSRSELYTARLIEGYDLAGIMELFGDDLEASAVSSGINPIVKRRLAVAINGKLSMERTALTPSALADNVQRTVFDTIHDHNLLTSEDSVILGLSGGVDSGSLLMLLSRYRNKYAANLTIRAVTFQDFDSQYSETFDFAARLADQFQVEHALIPAETAVETFHLARPISQILMLLMETEDAHRSMYVDHHATRRLLEVFADTSRTRNVAIGLHATDLLAGLLNSWTSGYDIAPAPERPVGDYRYVLPLAFVTKRDLHVFYSDMLGHLPKQTAPNQWEFNPTDRNFYYYMADQLQWFWPGIQHWLLTAQSGRAIAPVFRNCENCGGATRQIDAAADWIGLCDVCDLLDRHGWIANH